jgi:glycine/D-amino acid oxidase-like deaminating enzyme
VTLPRRAQVVVVGAGVHGLSIAYHLSEAQAIEEPRQRGVVVLEKSRVGAGASGVSGGIVRNFYLSAAMNEIVRQSVEIFEVDPSLFGFCQVGYIAVVPEAQAAELEQIAAQQAAIGYASRLTTGRAASMAYLRNQLADWTAKGAKAVLHEKRSGWADPRRTLRSLTGMARSAGALVLEGVEVVGFELSGGAVSKVHTSVGSIECDVVVIAPGPWARDLWGMLELPDQVTIETHDYGVRSEPLFRYWQVREGEFVHSEGRLERTAPVIHLDVDMPLTSPSDGSELLAPPWGIYFRPGLGRGVACGGLPIPLELDCPLDPYGPSHEEYGKPSAAFDRTTTVALAWTLGRFAARGGTWRSMSFAAPTCFTPDSHPVVGFIRENVYAVLDSNHGFKMLALGKLAAEEIVQGFAADELEPFRFGRFETALMHPPSTSPYPWV